MNPNIKDIWILGINPCINGMNYHDPSAALFRNEEIICAIEEERLNGIKGSSGIFPTKAIKQCLKIADISINDISYFSIGYQPSLIKNRIGIETYSVLYNSNIIDMIFDAKNGTIQPEIGMKHSIISALSNLSKVLNQYDSSQLLLTASILKHLEMPKGNVSFFEHHLCHIASSYYPSRFNEALGIVIDGVGEVESTSIWKINNGTFKKILELNMPNSLGYFYAAATALLGFKPWSGEGKLMAMAPYGNCNKDIYEKLSKIIDITEPIYNVSDFISKNIENGLALDIKKSMKILSSILNCPPRKEDEIITKKHKDIAWCVQDYLEKAVVNLIEYGIEKTGIKNVCVAGGVFLNCKMNMVIRERTNINNFFVQPVANDSGLAIGAALLINNKFDGNLKNLSLGTSYSQKEIQLILTERKIYFKVIPKIYEYVAKLLADKKTIFWFQDKMEFGKRALGFRSILADPRDDKVSDFLNSKIKHRELWRPFACSIIHEYASDVLINFDSKNKYPYMIEAFKVKKRWQKKIPAVIHKADGTTRPQTVSFKDSPLYYMLIKEFYELTEIPLILNTSLNDVGQPIISHPIDAIKFYFSSQVDYLVLGNCLIKKTANAIN